MYRSTTAPESSSESSAAPEPASESHSRAPPILRKTKAALLGQPTSGRSGMASSVRIRRQQSSQSITQAESPNDRLHRIQEEHSSRRRSSSEPQRPVGHPISLPGQTQSQDWANSVVDSLPSLPEEQRRPQVRLPAYLAPHLAPHFSPHLRLHGSEEAAAAHAAAHIAPHVEPSRPPSETPGRLRRATNATRSALGLRNHDTDNPDASTVLIQTDQGLREYDSDMVDLLDVIDPEVSTLSTLTNVQNSLFIPHIGSLFNRRPTYNLTRQGTARTIDTSQPSKPANVADGALDTFEKDMAEQEQTEYRGTARPPLTHSNTISSSLSVSRFAVLPHGKRLDGWTQEEKEELNDLVRHMLHSRRAGFKRGMKGFKQYVKKPLGLFVTIYATLITLFGLAWVLFLIGWISVGSKKDYLVNIIDNVLVALFAIMGDGLIPFRTIDTYHMIYIAHYHRLTWSIRKKNRLAKLEDRNDLPAKALENVDIEAAASEIAEGEHIYGEVSVLSPEQQKKLEHHQKKFARSHTFYKPHETETHYAFPLRLLVAIVIILDCHSLLQLALGACTWGISYKVRPFALTTVILCFSICCNITGGLLISIGDRRTRKKDVIERMFRQELTTDAMRKVAKRKERERREANGEVVEEEEFETETKREYEARKKAEKAEIKRSWKNLYLKPVRQVEKLEQRL